MSKRRQSAIRLLLWTTVAAALLSACEKPATDPVETWPLSCEYASFDLPADLLAHCGRRLDDGRIEVRPDVLAAIGPESGIQSLRAADRWLFARGGKTAPALPFDNGPDYFREGLARILVDGRVGFVDERLETVVEPVWDFAFPFENGVAVVCTGCRRVADGEHTTLEGGGWGYIDPTGAVVLEPVHSRDDLPSPPGAGTQ